MDNSRLGMTMKFSANLKKKLICHIVHINLIVGNLTDYKTGSYETLEHIQSFKPNYLFISILLTEDSKAGTLLYKVLQVAHVAQFPGPHYKKSEVVKKAVFTVCSGSTDIQNGHLRLLH